jgi:hypothetical protein
MKKISLIIIPILLFGSMIAQAQDEATQKQLSQIAKQEFPNDPEGDITFGVEQGYPYYITHQSPSFITNIYVNTEMEKMSIHVITQSPGQINMFKKKYLTEPAFKKIQQYLSKYKKSLTVGWWFANYYANGKGYKEMVSFTEFEQGGKGDAVVNEKKIEEVYFDLQGNLLGKGDFDINKALTVTLDMTKGLDDYEGNGEESTHATEASLDLFKINTKYYIRNVKHDLYMDVYGNSMEDRGRVVVYKHTNSANQQFEILSVDARTKHKIQNVNSLKVLSGLPESTNIIQFESDAGERQIFEIEKVEGNSVFIRLALLYNGKYLGVEGNKGVNGSNIYEKESNPMDESLQWELIPVEN